MQKNYGSIALLLLLISGCQHHKEQQVVHEYFMTERDRERNVDSVAIWHGPHGQHWLIATAKATHTLPVYDAATGAYLHSIGTPGTQLGQLQRPNGIAVLDDLLFIVERDNARLQLFDLPSGTSLALMQEPMQRPYGIAAYTIEPNKTYMVYVTDNAGAVDTFWPKKVHQYRITRNGQKATIAHLGTFGDNDGPGALWKVESIAVDPVHNRLYIADEHEQRKNVKVYTLDGDYTGVTIGDGLIVYEPEGIAIYPTSETDGYIVVTDQDKKGNQFLLFDRQTMLPVSSFVGKTVRNTDGIAVTERAFGPFEQGALYAVHDDGNIGVYDWRYLERCLGLKGR